MVLPAFNSVGVLTPDTDDDIQSGPVEYVVDTSEFDAVEAFGNVRAATDELIPVSFSVFAEGENQLRDYTRDNSRFSSEGMWNMAPSAAITMVSA